MKNKVKIAIIDSGINKDELRCDNKIQVENIFSKYEYLGDRNGHGTSIANIILSHNDNVIFYTLKIFDEQLSCSCEILVEALKTLLDSDVDIINLSLGITMDNIELYNICLKLVKIGKIVIAAHNNINTISYPSSYPFIYGVESASIFNINEYVLSQIENKNVYCYGYMQKGLFSTAKHSKKGNSFAAAHFVGIISNYLLANNQEISNIIIKNSIGMDKYKKYIMNIENIDWIHDIVIFPLSIDSINYLNKEKFYNIIGFYTGKDIMLIKETINYGINKLLLFDSLDDITANYDTVFVGDVNNDNVTLDIKKNVVLKCFILGKNVFCQTGFDSVTNRLFYNLAEKLNIKFYIKYL